MKKEKENLGIWECPELNGTSQSWKVVACLDERNTYFENVEEYEFISYSKDRTRTVIELYAVRVS